MGNPSSFSFSFSRLGSFNGCKRQYYLNYYGSRNGWFKSSPKEVQETYFLKKLTGIYAWAGSIVHDIIEEALKEVRSTSIVKNLDYWIDIALTTLKDQYAESQRRVKQKRDGNFYSYKMFGLKEHEYDIEMDVELRKKIKNRVITCLTNFFSSEIYTDILNSDPETWLAIEDFSTFLVPIEGGYKVETYSVPDFAKRVDDKVVIYDWKTGKKNSKYKDQLALYSLYANKIWGFETENVESIIYYLLEDKVIKGSTTKEDLENISNKISDGALEMMKLLENEDPFQNKPLPKEKFPLTSNRFECRFCNFEKVCGIRESV